MQGSTGSLVTTTKASALARSSQGLPILIRASRLSAATGMFPGSFMDASLGFHGGNVWPRTECRLCESLTHSLCDRRTVSTSFKPLVTPAGHRANHLRIPERAPAVAVAAVRAREVRSEEHTSELQSLR